MYFVEKLNVTIILQNVAWKEHTDQIFQQIHYTSVLSMSLCMSKHSFVFVLRMRRITTARWISSLILICYWSNKLCWYYWYWFYKCFVCAFVRVFTVPYQLFLLKIIGCCHVWISKASWLHGSAIRGVGMESRH